MPRLAALVLAATLGLTHLAAAPAEATAETCRGVAATIVGTPGAELTGTPGADVVVTNGAQQVDTGDGDDLVCTTGTTSQSSAVDVEVVAGAGDDIVDTTGEQFDVDTGTTLGDGDDVFYGGAVDDSVDARDEWRDTVHTGGGNDFVATGSSTGTDDDRVDTGASGDRIGVEGNVAVTSEISGGAGRDSLHVNVRSAGRWVFDNRTGEAIHDGVTAWRWEGLEQFFMTQTKAVGRLSFVGGPADDLLYVSTSAFAGARLGGGDDDVFVASPRRLTGSPAIRAGSGSDHLWLMAYGTRSPVRRARLDLGSGSLRYEDHQGLRTSLAVTGFEGADVHAHTVRMTGSSGDEWMVAWACDVELHGRAGKDALGTVVEGKCGTGARRTLVGGAGDDRLSGSIYADLLVGGPGFDRVDGLGGGDRCDAEVEKRCE